MPANHYALLIGDAPKEGHIPTTYSLSTQYQVFLHQLIQEYGTFLVHALFLDNSIEPIQPKKTSDSDITRLEAENSVLKKLLTELLNR